MIIARQCIDAVRGLQGQSRYHLITERQPFTEKDHRYISVNGCRFTF